MSDYSITTDFAAKDALSTGDANKLVKGTEISAELQAIRTAVNSKADTSSPTLTGTPLAPTATSGTSSTQIATTAFVATAIAALYPVGSIYTNASVSTNPGTLLGFGTWTAFGAGRVMVGFDSGNTLFDTAEETGGSADAITVSHTHSVTDPGHVHSIGVKMDAAGAGAGGYVNYNANTTFNSNSATTGISIASTGSSGTNANYQPYITVYMWKRTA